MATLYATLLTSFLALAATKSVVVETREAFADIGAHAVEAKDSKIIRREARGAAKESDASAAKAASSCPHGFTAYQCAIIGEVDAETGEAKNGLVAHYGLNELSCGTPCETEPIGPACGEGIANGDPCRAMGSVLGNVKLNASSLIHSQPQDKAMLFDGAAEDMVTIPDHELINTNYSGYPERTIEFWMEAGDLGENINRSVFSEGQQDRAGINIYARSHKNADGNKSTRLYMYVWNRKDGENKFGTRLINFEPLECDIEEHTPYYVAFTFNTEPRKVIGYIARPHKALEECGRMDDLPNEAHIPHHGHDDNVAAVIGGVLGANRTTGLTHMPSGASHNWVGSIDEVAIYNKALLAIELWEHVKAARR